MSNPEQKDQEHPQAKRDRQVVSQLLQSEPNPYQLAELARLRIRYQQFPGAKDIKADLDLVLKNWSLSEAQLLAKTRQIHAQSSIYQEQKLEGDREDWN
ncbi:DUF3288 family protein [Merismopedia glauca]|uniref:DUF3288 domain-containing protein n=1 Tax=Merismopedia glauca CCAP 1448/3 TaxID=1296344 RepID=A0A2T1C8E2_9CYAN|nr:DUF3288 family protein [Merismopedia glauca]PSB04545.1 DUF3288 domain-containing protein [Merismopedia glauca CCAP 1448/3]